MALDVRTGPVTQVAPAVALGAQRARYLPIAEHGLIGDLHTVALVGTDGTIDWYCCPRFDSPSVFAAILDADRGGLFRIGPDGDGWTSKQLYLPDTNVLITRFLMADGVGEVRDFIVPAHPGRLIRRVVAVREQVRFVVDVAPRFDYARARHEVTLTPHGAITRSDELRSASRRTVRSRSSMAATSRAHRAAGRRDGHLRARTRRARRAAGALLRCRRRRRVRRRRGVFGGWLSRSRYSGRWREMVHRSALTLKLLTYTRRPARSRPPPPACPAARGRAQLGLPLHVDARLRLLALRAAQARLHRRGRRVHGVAGGALSPRGRPRSGPLQIMYGIVGARSCPSRSSRTWRATWARAGADRQRAGDPAAARHLRRADGRHVPVQ